MPKHKDKALKNKGTYLMKKSFKSKIILLLVIVASLFIFAGCSFNRTIDEIRQKYNLTEQVTYYANGGAFENGKDVKDIYYKPRSKMLEIKEQTVSSVSITRKMYELTGWYKIKTDDLGNLLYTDTEKTKFDLESEPIDFSTYQLSDGEGEHLHLAAAWKPDVKVLVHLVTPTPIVKTVDNQQVTFNSGDEVNMLTFEELPDGTLKAEEAREPEKCKPENNSHTFVSYYKDEACTQLVEWPLVTQRPDSSADGEVQHVIIYAKYLEGRWTILKTAEDVKTNVFANMLGSSTNKLYLIRDIDCSAMPMTLAPSNFAGTLEGNGFTIKNVTINRTLAATQTKYSLLGTIKRTAKIRNVTFENVVTNLTITPKLTGEDNRYVYLAFDQMSTDATVENVSIDHKITLTLPSANTRIGNMWRNNGSGYAWDYTTSVKFGGYATDAEYAAGGITLTASSAVTITNPEIVG